MSRPRILNIEPEGWPAEARDILRPVASLTERTVGRPELIRILPRYDVLLTRLGHRIDRPILRAASRLKAVATPTTGLDHIDLRAAAERGVHVISLKGDTRFLRTVTATAEHSFGLLLALARRLPAAVEHVRRGGWDRDRFRGMELSGKTLGIVGLGRLGRMVARYGRSFGMRVLAYDPASPAPPPGVRRVRLETLLRRADAVTLHVPLDESTEGIFGRSFFAAMKPGSFFINTSRGALIDEAALLEALTNGRLAGAALDVVRDERPGRSRRRPSPLLAYARKHDNLIITPHIGGATRDSMRKAEIHLARKLRGFLAGRT